jgi:HAD superfamily hydrolase (TIGR01509 family)
MTNGYRFAILDLDGTLIDQTQNLYRCCAEALATIGESPPTMAVFIRAIGRSPEVWMRQFAPSTKADTAIECYQRLLTKSATYGVSLMPGCTEFLKCMHQSISLALVTNRNGTIARQILENRGLGGFFQLVLGAGDTPWQKPQREIILHALDRLNAIPIETVVVGDSPVDVIAARAAGLDSLAVASGAYSLDELRVASATYVVPSLDKAMPHLDPPAPGDLR